VVHGSTSHQQENAERDIEAKHHMIAARNASANRSLIAFTAWSSFAHAAVVTVTAFSKGGYRGDLWGVAVLVIIGATLIVLAPAKQSGERVSAAVV
jgi:Family of unknown function (DUF6632)